MKYVEPLDIVATRSLLQDNAEKAGFNVSSILKTNEVNELSLVEHALTFYMYFNVASNF